MRFSALTLDGVSAPTRNVMGDARDPGTCGGLRDRFTEMKLPDPKIFLFGKSHSVFFSAFTRLWSTTMIYY